MIRCLRQTFLKDRWCRQTAGHTDRRAEPWCEGWSLWEGRECKCPAGFSASVTPFAAALCPKVLLFSGEMEQCVWERERDGGVQYMPVIAWCLSEQDLCVCVREKKSWQSFSMCQCICYCLCDMAVCVSIYVCVSREKDEWMMALDRGMERKMDTSQIWWEISPLYGSLVSLRPRLWENGQRIDF